MKKIIGVGVLMLLAFLLLAIPLQPAKAAPACHNFNSFLMYGSSGVEVKYLQQALDPLIKDE